MKLKVFDQLINIGKSTLNFKEKDNLFLNICFSTIHFRVRDIGVILLKNIK